MFSLRMIARTRPLFLSLLAVLVVASGCQRVPLLAPSGSTITLTTSATTLPANGTVTILAQVIEPAGTPPHSGTHITFTTTLGTIQPSDVETDINGTATVTFNAGVSSGTATITASSGGASTGTAGAIKIAIGAAAVGRISVSANPGTVAASGGTSTITASVGDANGNVLPGVPVTFTTTAGSFTASVVNTDASGNAQTTLTTNKTATVTATAGVQGTTTPAPAPATPGTPTGGTTSTQQSATVTISVNTASTVTVGAPSPASPVVGQPVVFGLTYSASTTGTSSPIARVIVDFGDGTAAQTIAGQPSAVTHTYNQIGSFTVRVTAIDTFGDVATGSGSVTVGARPQIVVGIVASATPPTVGTPTTFTISATPTTGNVITSVTVDLGDGTRRTLSGAVGSIQYAYSTAGTYVVTAIATDSSGATGSATTSIVVGGRTQLAVTISASATPTVGAPVTFTIAATASAGATISSIFINFGDGSSVTLTGNATTVQHSYTSAGNFTVTATATDTSGATGSASTVIIVAARALTANFTVTPTSPKVGVPAVFDASTSSPQSAIVSYDWDFGDSTTATVQAPSITHTYQGKDVGTLVVVLTVTDDTGKKATKSQSVVVVVP
jgi:PKD repeat protein